MKIWVASTYDVEDDSWSEIIGAFSSLVKARQVLTDLFDVVAWEDDAPALRAHTQVFRYDPETEQFSIPASMELYIEPFELDECTLGSPSIVPVLP